jgi:hypothetical protein
MAEDPEQLRAQAKLWRAVAAFHDDDMRRLREAKAQALEHRADRLPVARGAARPPRRPT